MITTYFVWFGICFICYIIRTIFNTLNYKKSPITENKKIVTVIYIVMGILWFSWFQMCFIDPVKIEIPHWIRYIGLVLFIIGVSLFILSNMKLKGFKSGEGLVTTGIYSKIRNPMYLGFIIWIIGFPIFTKSFITLTTSVIWIAHIMYWKQLEEKEFETKYNEYKNYKKKTWF